MAQLKNEEQLLEWLDEADILFQLNKQGAKTILSYLKESGKSLETAEGRLILYDEVSDTKTNIMFDEAVDMACEANYERIEETIQRIADADREEDIMDDERYLTELSQDEDILDEVFKQTCYQTEVARTVKLLVEEPKPLSAGYRR